MFPLDETAVVITRVVKTIKSPVQNIGEPENMTGLCALRTGIEKHCPKPGNKMYVHTLYYHLSLTPFWSAIPLKGFYYI